MTLSPYAPNLPLQILSFSKYLSIPYPATNPHLPLPKTRIKLVILACPESLHFKILDAPLAYQNDLMYFYLILVLYIKPTLLIKFLILYRQLKMLKSVQTSTL